MDQRAMNVNPISQVGECFIITFKTSQAKLTLKDSKVAIELELEFNYMRLIMGQETALLFENESSINICGTG